MYETPLLRLPKPPPADYSSSGPRKLSRAQASSFHQPEPHLTTSEHPPSSSSSSKLSTLRRRCCVLTVRLTIFVDETRSFNICNLHSRASLNVQHHTTPYHGQRRRPAPLAQIARAHSIPSTATRAGLGQNKICLVDGVLWAQPRVDAVQQVGDGQGALRLRYPTMLRKRSAAD